MAERLTEIERQNTILLGKLSKIAARRGVEGSSSRTWGPSRLTPDTFPIPRESGPTAGPINIIMQINLKQGREQQHFYAFLLSIFVYSFSWLSA